MRCITMGSLFDGIGGFPLAARHNGVIPLWASEIEPFPIRVTQQRLPGMLHYMLQVNRFEIVDYRAYTSALQYDGTDRSRIPDKIALVSVTVSQQNSSAEGFPLTELSLYTTDMLMNMDWDLLGVVNPILDGATGIRLQDGASCDILLPFDLYRYRFTSSEWNGLEQSSIWLQVTNYPTRKIIQVNIGEE